MVSLGLIYGFFRVHLGLHVGFLIRISLGFLWVAPRVSLGFHLGYKQNNSYKTPARSFAQKLLDRSCYTGVQLTSR